MLCHVTVFYPSDITVTWMRNGRELYKNVKVGKLLPNEDGTFQKTVTLQTEPDEWRKNEFSCVVKHQNKTIRKTLTENEIRTNNGKRLCTSRSQWMFTQTTVRETRRYQWTAASQCRHKYELVTPVVSTLHWLLLNIALILKFYYLFIKPSIIRPLSTWITCFIRTLLLEVRDPVISVYLLLKNEAIAPLQLQVWNSGTVFLFTLDLLPPFLPLNLL